MSNSLLLEDFTLNYPNMRVSRFSLKVGEKIPLHVHQNQFGLAYLIQGRCLVTSYVVNKTNDDLFLLTLDKKQELLQHSYCILTPQVNAHEIYAHEDSIFLDIFAPGNNGERISDYLKVVSDKNGSQLTAIKMSSEETKLLASHLLNDSNKHLEIS